MENITSEISRKPIFFERNRVFRVYLGGKLFNDFFGDEPTDGNYPEEWIASAVKALNSNSTDPNEGLSKVQGTDIYLDELIEKERENILGGHDSLGILVKMLDSAVRLPIQAHPDKPFSRKHFNSEYGKAEAWIVFATRENAKIYFGFKDKITKEEFVKAIERSETEKDAMEELLNEIPAKAGDVYFIPAKQVHAIGYGCMILEIQEPTDFTIQPEAWCADYKLNDYEKYLGLNPDDALECFDFSVYGDAAVALGKKAPKIIKEDGGVVSEQLIGREDTPCFAVKRHTVTNGTFRELSAPAVYVVTDGEGEIKGEDYSKPIKKGDYFLLPKAAEGRFEIASNSSIQIVECIPPFNV
ncbi:MAG TPA: class I mannose-6-phosphate isomerase [Clostridiales bacterium]|nr:class I mannose-6-phosphate isomerase [Clostridiales bacterium]HPP68504.1 class I mannose-6-phosphate isomerase [Clostridiales bacterium]